MFWTDSLPHFLLIVATVATAMGGCAKRLLTYNTGLTLNVPEYDQRRYSMIEALKQSKSHFVCLQEVWYAEDVHRIVTETLSAFPYSYSVLHRSDIYLDINGSPCGLFDYVAYTTLACVSSKGCLAKSSYAEAIECGETECQFTEHLSQECIVCAMQSSITTWNLISKCLTTTKGVNTGGLLMLSKHPLTYTTSVSFYPGIKQLLPRNYLQAKVDGIGTVLCTHLTPNLGPVYYEPNLKISHDIKSWEEQNRNEAELLVAVTKPNKNALILGDLNCGPTKVNTTVSGDFEETFNYFLQNKFKAPYVDLVGICTWCSNNSLVHPSYVHNHVYDHVLVKGHQVISAKRYYFKNITSCEHPMSDHYGVQVTIHAEQHDITEDEDDDCGY